VSAATDTPIVELVGITKSFPGVLANDRIDLTLRTGEVHCLLGENGAGKSTLIGILSGLHRPDAGTIRVDGVDKTISSPRTALELGIGTVPQHSALIPALTVLENLMLGDTRRLRLDEAGARKRLGELAQLLGVQVDPDTKAAAPARRSHRECPLSRYFARQAMASRVIPVPNVEERLP